MATAASSSADEVLREHGFDGDRLARLCESVLIEGLRRRGSVLWPDRREDLHSYLCLTACHIATNYDPSRSRPGYSFASYLWDVLDRRITDWFRQTFGDSRYADGPNKRRIPLTSLLSLDAKLDEDPVAEDVTLIDASLDLAVEAVGERCSRAARETLATIARPLAEGYRPLEVSRKLGISTSELNERLRQLRDELDVAA